jgi:hypothetical protein
MGSSALLLVGCITQWCHAANPGQAEAAPRPTKPVSQDVQVIHRDMCEVGPFIWHDRLCLLECIRPGHGGKPEDHYLQLRDTENGEVLATFARGYSLASIIVHDGALYAFAARWENNTWNDVTLFKSSDLQTWQQRVVIEQENEGLFNSSVCKGPDGFVMAYESNESTYPAFTTKFARSDDLEHWTKLPESTFGTNRYTACPCIRYVNGYYYVLYLERRAPRWFFETYVTRSKDLKDWRLSSANPVLAPDAIDDGINASDPDIIEYAGKTYVYYSVGDQLTWMNIKRATYPGSMQEFFEAWYADDGIPDPGVLRATTK